MKHRWSKARSALCSVLFLGSAGAMGAACSESNIPPSDPSETDPQAAADETNDTATTTGLKKQRRPKIDFKAALAAGKTLAEGRDTFRFDTFGDEAFWGGTLRLHEAIAGTKNGGVGDGVSPNTALAVGLKVDSEALPRKILKAIQNGEVNLDDPGTTLTLLRHNAVVGVTGVFDEAGTLNSLGIQCALCHSVVDDSVAKGIGKRLDGWANRDVDAGAIVSLSPDLSALSTLLGVSDADVRAVLAAWGPGKFDAELILDGRGSRPDGKSGATLIPPAFGLAGVNLHTWTGWGSVPYWNAFVAVLEMHGVGTFFDPRLDDEKKFPIAAKNGFGHIMVDEDEDRVTPKLAALQQYQLSLVAPTAPGGSFDPEAAERGGEIFVKEGKCTTCHTEPSFTEPGWNLHKGEEFGVDDFQSSRSPDGRYRTTPLKGLWTHQKGGFFHDGRFATLLDVVNHYDRVFSLGLTDQQKDDLVEYLKSL